MAAIVEDAAKGKENPVTVAAKRWKDKGYKLMCLNLPITGEWVLKRFMESLLSIAAGDAYNYLLAQKVKLMVNINGDFPIDSNRNLSVIAARDVFLADYTLHLDNDQTFPSDTVMNLWESLNGKAPDGSQVEFVAGMYYLKRHPFRPVIGRYVKNSEAETSRADHFRSLGLWCDGECGDPAHKAGAQIVRFQAPHFWPTDKLYRADVIGVGCCMTSMAVWNKLEYPYFRYTLDPSSEGGPGAKTVSEDMAWCAQLHKAGVKIWIDPRVQCGHVGVLEANEGLYLGAFEDAYKTMAALPEGDENRKNFMANILDVRNG